MKKFNIRYKKGFKVCYQNFLGKYQSAFLLGKNTEYKIGEWTKRPKECGPLAIFKYLKNAKLFIKRTEKITSMFAIFKCKYKESEEKELYYINFCGKKLINNMLNGFPEGTILADKIKILKEVKK